MIAASRSTRVLIAVGSSRSQPRPARPGPSRSREALRFRRTRGRRGIRRRRATGSRCGPAPRPRRAVVPPQAWAAPGGAPGPAAAEVAVVGILPGLEAQFGARGAGGGAAHAQQRPGGKGRAGRPSRLAICRRIRGRARARRFPPGRRGCGRAGPRPRRRRWRPRRARRTWPPGPRLPGRLSRRPARPATAALRTGSRPSLPSSATALAARSLEPGCSPWSTVTPLARAQPRRHERRGRRQRQRVGATGKKARAPDHRRSSRTEAEAT